MKVGRATPDVRIIGTEDHHYALKPEELRAAADLCEWIARLEVIEVAMTFDIQGCRYRVVCGYDDTSTFGVLSVSMTDGES